MTQLQNSLFLASINHFPKVAAALCLAVALGACSSDSGDDDDGSAGATAGSGGDPAGSGGSTAGSGGGTAGSGGSTAGSGGGTSCLSCDDGCPNIACQCQDGSIVNTTFCSNGCCQPKEIACPDACSDSGGWVSGSGGTGGGDTGGTGGTGGSSGSTANPIGGECQQDPDCSSNICLFKTGAAFGYCSKTCEDWTDCPDFWDCSAVGNASGTYCVQD